MASYPLFMSGLDYRKNKHQYFQRVFNERSNLFLAESWIFFLMFLLDLLHCEKEQFFMETPVLLPTFRTKSFELLKTPFPLFKYVAHNIQEVYKPAAFFTHISQLSADIGLTSFLFWKNTVN